MERSSFLNIAAKNQRNLENPLSPSSQYSNTVRYCFTQRRGLPGDGSGKDVKDETCSLYATVLYCDGVSPGDVSRQNVKDELILYATIII